MKKTLTIIFALFFNTLFLSAQNIECKLPEVIITEIPMKIEISSDSILNITNVSINNEPVEFEQNTDYSCEIKYIFDRASKITIKVDETIIEKDVKPLPLWMSIIPPLLAIFLAFILKEVFTSLFIGLLSGTTILSFYAGNNIFAAIFTGFLRVIDTLIVESIFNKGHISIIVFSMIIGGLVKIISANGGMTGLVNVLSKRAKTKKSGQLITWLLGLVIFFDDYANTLIIGNSMRPVTDKLKISREKLSYIVDSTAAPVAAIAFITTWIGVELSYIQNGLNVIGLEMSPYKVFLHSLQYSFYPILTIIFVLMIILSGRDYGLMKRNRTLKDEDIKNTKIETVDEKTSKWYNAVIPILVLIFGVIIGLYFTGYNEVGWRNEFSFTQNISTIVGAADSYKALLWSSLTACTVAIIMSLSMKLLNLKSCMDNLIEGFKTMLPAIVILVLAWSIAGLTEKMHTAEFFSGLLIKINVPHSLLPAIAFLFGFLIAFSTGTSWGTMAILYPLILPASWMICISTGISDVQTMSIFYGVTASVLAGAVFGDHCSPISDTTILSSLATSCNHINHVKTQMPYAITVGIVSFIGLIFAGLGVAAWIIIPICIFILWGIIRIFGVQECESK